MRFALPMLLIALFARVEAASVPLFDATTLTGWQGDTTVWRVQDGGIVGGSLSGNPRNAFLATTKTYRNVVLSLEYRLVGTEGFINDGVIADKVHPWFKEYPPQVQLRDRDITWQASSAFKWPRGQPKKFHSDRDFPPELLGRAYARVLRRTWNVRSSSRRKLGGLAGQHMFYFSTVIRIRLATPQERDCV